MGKVFSSHGLAAVALIAVACAGAHSLVWGEHPGAVHSLTGRAPLGALFLTVLLEISHSPVQG